LLTGTLDPERARLLRDADGVTLETAMREAGADPAALGKDEERLASIGAFVELHIEQGRNLGPLGAPLGVATGIWPHGRWRCLFDGEANHAGTTWLADRHDPVLVFASVALAARRLAAELGGHATVGKVRVEPNATNAIAGSVTAWLDVRAPDEATVTHLVEALIAAAEPTGAEHGVGTSITEESFTPAVTFDGRLRDRVADVLGGAPELATAAGHDAGILAERVPAAMIFVRNPSGASHTPAESAELDDCLVGVRGLEAVLEELACGPPLGGAALSSADQGCRRGS
ncbi:MAG TPA: allantoate amidohydrolase, partial [Acidimicrobiales bacterium]|nr:allantoate amidohydrolase [Acidimicrobiales bacterium]